MRKITLLSFAFLATYSAGVAYAQTEQSALQTAIAEAEAVEAKSGVGYPTENSSARNTLLQAINTAKEAEGNGNETEAVTALNAAVNIYKSTTTEIQMPEDGKVYTITAIPTSGNRGYINYTSGTGYGIVSTTETTNTNYPTSAKFICKTTTNGGTIFINSEGKSLIFAGNKSTIGYNSNKGYVDPTDENFLTYAPLTVSKMVKSGNAQVTSASNQAALFGYVILKGARPNKGTNNVFIITKSGSGFTFNQADALVFYNGVNSSAFLIEEAPASEEVTSAMSQGVGQVASAIIGKYEVYIDKTGVGYPASNSEARTTLSAAINKAKAAIAAGTATVDNIIFNEWDAFLADTNVQMPEEGKAYTLTFVANNGNKYYIDYAADGYRTVQIASDATETALPTTAKLICRKTTDGKYIFVNNEGKYLAWKGTGSGANVGYNGNKGYADSYSTTTNIRKCLEFSLSKLSKSESQTIGQVVTITANSNADLFGFMKAISDRRSETTDSKGCLTLNTNNNTFDNSNGANFRNGYTAALLIEEAQYPNTVTLNDATGIEGVQKIGTFSAPFRTIVPTGVKAYYVSDTESGNGTTATTTAIAEGEAIPANTGVLLTTTDAAISSATMVPALAETDATIAEGSNLLHASAGASKEIPTTENAYILTKQDNQVAFYLCSPTSRTIGMNKSYLVLPTTAAASKFTLNFGTVTGINNLPTVDGAESNAPVYDLTGRRVSNLQKGGLYIKGGKKFIVK